MTEAIYEGGCLCGAIRYRATANPTRCMICHCQTCRKHSGGPCLSFVHFPVESFSWLGAKPKRFRSSAFAERGFCAACGSTISMHEEVLADLVQIALGSLDQPERVRPDDHVWTKSRIAWFDISDNLPRFPGNSPAVPSKALDD